MRKIAILITIIFFGINSFAQENDNLYNKKFNIGLDIYNNFWLDLPDNMSQKGLNLGYSVYGMYNHQLKKSKYSVAFGGGITSFVLGSNTIVRDVTADVINFDTIADGISYDRSKVTFSYLDIPIEFRYKSENEFRLAFGFKFGFRLDNHSTYKGERLDGSGTYETVKQKDIKHINSYLSFSIHNQCRCQLRETDYFPSISRYKLFSIFLELERNCLLAHWAGNI